MLLKKDIIKIQNILRDQQPMLNNGGCGVFALTFVNLFGGEILRLDHLTSFRYLFNPKPIHVNVFEAMENCDLEEYWSSSHFIIKYRNMHFDGHDFVEKADQKYYDSKLNKKFDMFNMKANDGTFVPITNTMTYEYKHIRQAVYNERIWNMDYFSDINMNPTQAIDEMYRILKPFK